MSGQVFRGRVFHPPARAASIDDLSPTLRERYSAWKGRVRISSDGKWLLCSTCDGRTRDPAKHLAGGGCRYKQAIRKVDLATREALRGGLLPCDGSAGLLHNYQDMLTLVPSHVMNSAVEAVEVYWAPAWAVSLAKLKGPPEWRHFLIQEALASTETQRCVDAVVRLSGKGALQSWAEQAILIPEKEMSEWDSSSKK